MKDKLPKAEKKRTGPKPELFSLYPLKFDEAVDSLVKAKPKQRKEAVVEKEKCNPSTH
jgi:hypothetical protein